MTKLWNSVRREIVEKLFEQELDEDFQLGIEEGRDRTQIILLRQLELTLAQGPKKNQPGLQMAIDVIKATAL